MNSNAQVPFRSARMISPVLAALLLAGAVPAFADHLEKHFDVQPRPVVMIHNLSGKVLIQSWQKQEVDVVADHNSNDVSVDATQKGNLIEITTRPRSEYIQPNDLHADYTLNVPQDAELQIHNDSGKVQILRILGDTAVDTETAGVELEDMGGYLSVKTIGGSVDCIRCDGRIEISSFTGNLRLLQDQSSNIRAQTTNGSILFDSEFLPNGVYLLKNYSGPIELRFSPSDSFTLNATSLRGKVNNEAQFTPALRSPSRVSRFTHSMFGSINQGLARVDVTSFNGTINVRKRE